MNSNDWKYAFILKYWGWWKVNKYLPIFWKGIQRPLCCMMKSLIKTSYSEKKTHIRSWNKVPGPGRAGPCWTESWFRCVLEPVCIPQPGSRPSGEGSSETGARRTPPAGLGRTHAPCECLFPASSSQAAACDLTSWFMFHVSDRSNMQCVRSLPSFMKSVLPVKTLSATVMRPGRKQGSSRPFSLHILVSSSDGFRQSLQALYPSLRGRQTEWGDELQDVVFMCDTKWWGFNWSFWDASFS